MNKLGKYQIRRTLGKGAMGIVYEGFDPVIERTVAIKTILPSQLQGSEYVAVMARFKREAQAAGRLNHPGIVAIYEYGEDIAQDVSDEEATMLAAPPGQAQRVAFIAMEFVQGRELRDYFEQGERFPLPEVARLMGEMLAALDHAHAQGVVHRDMKPANIIVLANGKLKIADFGIARVESSELTQTGTVLGTPSYMSPEQFMGQPVDGRSDLFSCGVILYQLLTGEKPFTAESTTTLMYKVLREEPVPPSEINLALAPALDAVVRKALAKSPQARFQTGHEFAQALREAIELPGTPIAASAPAPSASASPAKPRSAGLLVAGVAGVAALGAVGYLFLGRGGSDAPTVAQKVPARSGAATPAPVQTAAAPAAIAALEPGTMVISALGVVEANDARFHGDAAAAQAQARDDAKRQLVEKALALYVEPGSIEKNRALLQAKLLSHSGNFIRTVIQEGAPGAAPGGLVEMQTRAVVDTRAVQKSLNELSREERVDFIRNKGDPRISIRIDIANADGGASLARERSQLAENVVKDRIKAFGFRVWSAEGEAPNPQNAQPADFAIRSEVKVKQLSMKLPASGLTITKTALTSWTLKAIAVATGEEVYVSTQLPAGKSWATEDQALAEIGKLVGDGFSRDFFLQHFNFRTQKTSLVVTGLPPEASAPMLRELRGMRPVLDAQPLAEPGKYQLQLAEGSLGDIVQETVVKPLNAKMGMQCFSLGGVNGSDVTVAFTTACGTAEMRTKLEAGPPAGWKFKPGTV